MKVVAYVMMVCLVFMFLLPAGAKTMRPVNCKSHCRMLQHLPRKAGNTNDCGQGTCSNILCCPACGFLNTEPVNVNTLMPVISRAIAIHFQTGNLADYSAANWNPPKV